MEACAGLNEDASVLNLSLCIIYAVFFLFEVKLIITFS